MAADRPPPSGPSAHRGLHKMASAHDLAYSGNLKSPLTQVRADLAQTTQALPVNPTLIRPNAPSIPALSLNLFRSASIYSVESSSSFDTVTSLSSSQEDDPSFVEQLHEQLQNRASRPESPSTPTAPRHGASYFDLPIPSQPASGQSTPKKGFFAASRPPRPISPGQEAPYLPPASASTSSGSTSTAHTARFPFSQPDLDVRSAEPVEPPTLSAGADWASIHGEQGSEWGEAEDGFEWLDADAPEAPNGDPSMSRSRSGTSASASRSSPSRRIVKQLRDAAGHVSHPNLGLGMGKEARKLRKQMIVSRRPPPPPPVSLERTDETIHTLPERTASKGMIAAPLVRRGTEQIEHPSLPAPRAPTLGGPPTPKVRAGQDVFGPSARQNEPGPPRVQEPTMVALKTADLPAPARPGALELNRDSGVALSLYSFYDLDANPSTPPADSMASDLVFPKGQYMKIAASGFADSPGLQRRAESPHAPEDLLTAGIEARSKGDLAKSAWLFMRSAEGGSVTGRIYWGLALRHGWGVAKDDKRAFAELRRACDESMADSGLQFHQSPAAKRWTVRQNKDVKHDLSLGLFEIANCFLDGVGVKKSPDVAVEYLKYAANLGDLASQEQLGFLLSKGGHGIKKDMKEAARWYRMAINQGSSNTFGLAWVWKDKYM